MIRRVEPQVMPSSRRQCRGLTGLVSGLSVLVVLAVGCDDAGGTAAGAGAELELREGSGVDVVEPELFELSASLKHSEAVAAYARRLEARHLRADEAASEDERLRLLESAFDFSVPEHEAGDDERALRVLRVELAARYAELAIDLRDADEVCERVSEILDPALPLPKDTVSARALVLLGDAAIAADRTRLAATAYMRSISVMDALRVDLEREMTSGARLQTSASDSRGAGEVAR